MTRALALLLPHREYPAVDPTTGNLYVPDAGNLRINEFRPVLNGSNEVSGVSFVHAFGWDVAPGAVNEQQEIRVKATGGKFVLSLGTGGPGVSETGEISATVTAGEVQSALNAITNVSTGGGSVTVSGGPGNAGGTKPYVVSFSGGPLAATDVAQLVATSAGGGSALSGGSPSSGVSIRTLANGHAATTGLEDCTEESGCQKGVGSKAQNVVQFAPESPGSIAVDFEGNVYSVTAPAIGEDYCGESGTGNCEVLKFSPDGESVSRFGPGLGESENNQCRLTYTSSAEKHEVVSVVAFAIAIDPNPAHHDNNVFVAKKTSSTTYRVYEFDSEGGASKGPAEKCSISPEKVDLTGSNNVANRALAVGTEERIYVDQTAGTTAKIYLLGPLPPASAQMVSATATGSTTAHFAGEVTPPAEVGGERVDTTWQFEYSTDQEGWTKVPLSDRDAGSVPSVPVTVEEEATGLEPNTKYFARVCATTSSAVCSAVLKFTTDTQAPSVIATYPEAATQNEATLVTQVNPNGLPSTYHFEWTTDGHWQQAHTYDHRIPAFERSLGSGGEAVIAQDTISGLQPESVYHFRVVTQNAAGTTDGPDQELETLDSCGLPDNRCYELVSPRTRVRRA